MSDVTQLLQAIQRGDAHATSRLLPLVYDELRRLAAAKFARESPGQTLQPTALVHVAYLRLVGGEQDRGWDNRAHFLGAAAEAMRRILIERARARNSLKRGGDREQFELEAAVVAAPDRSDELLALDEALHRLAAIDAQAAELVQLRYFGGCTMEEAAKSLGLTLRSAQRRWAYAKAWLLDALQAE